MDEDLLEESLPSQQSYHVHHMDIFPGRHEHRRSLLIYDGTTRYHDRLTDNTIDGTTDDEEIF